ncbi:MAG: 4'-phosphopantetheinyl transferase superfamily protein [Candidatus Babeliales bacterium]|nr:4'-phosphopantetheinyl transferase superfamily protein [Candidatus Babeliales bacterium]
MNIKIKIGCDIIHKDRFIELTQQESVLNKIFTKHELAYSSSLEKLIGVFAAKEAVLKALELKPGSWELIEVIKQENGKPAVKLLNYSGYNNIISQDISISHDGEYVFAVASFLITAENIASKS